MDKESFVLYTRYNKHIQKLSMEQRGVLFTAIMEYMSGNEIPEMDIATDMIFGIIIEDIEICNQKWEATRRARSEAGKASANKRQQTSTKVNKEEQTPTNPTVNVNVNDNVSPYGDKEKNNKKKIFKPPTPDEVRVYCMERGNTVDPNRFCDFYQSKDWMVGKTKMKDWRAAVRNWERNVASKSTVAGGRLDWIDDL